MAFHAFFGLAIMSGTGLLLSDWYGAMGWGTDALADQQLGGGIAWSVGEIPTVALAITVAVQWARSDEKESRRRDRHADRTGDAELEAYNARLAAIAEQDAHDPAGR
jgi:putative copper resistance protein D